MRGWSIPMGRLLGVEVRLHFFFALLLGLSLPNTGMSGMAAIRGVSLWLLLLGIVGLREIARAIVCAYYGLEVRSLLLLPIGGLPSYANPESAERASEGSAQIALAMAGPLTNFLAAFVLLGFILGVSPSVSMLAKPWVSADHLLRSAFWLNIFLAVINLLPAYPLDAGRLLRGNFSRAQGALKGTRAASGIGQVIAVALFVAGVFLQSPWLLLAGFFVFVGAQLEDQGMVFQSVVDTVRMRDIMLTDFACLSASTPWRTRSTNPFTTCRMIFRSCAAGCWWGGFEATDSGDVANRRQRLRAVDHVARIPSGAAGRFAGSDLSPYQCGTRTFPGSGSGWRADCWHRDTAKSDAQHGIAGGKPKTATAVQLKL